MGRGFKRHIWMLQAPQNIYPPFSGNFHPFPDNDRRWSSRNLAFEARHDHAFDEIALGKKE